ncbi:MAG: ribonuclease H-like domain-containing protein [Ignavibacteria bacterium]|nr:ribonuclease H-like domain-containing protein [Ignavibacteria bacterium]
MKEEYLVFDIETTPLDWDTFSESQKEYLLRNLITEEEKEKRKVELGLSPFTAQIICIGLIFVELENDNELTKKAVAYVVDNSPVEVEEAKIIDNFEIYTVTETKCLEVFWRILAKYPDIHLISFNGRNFDCPFIMLRSAIHGVVPTRNLMEGTKYNYQFHTDLLDELTFYQPTNYFSPTKRFNLDFYTRAFGIESPKAFGIDGSNVSQYYKEGNLIEIALYCLRDVNSTWELYKKIKKILFI